MNKRATVPDDRERAVLAWWRKSKLKPGTMLVYLQWVRRFRMYCNQRRLPEVEHLTAVGVRRFIDAYTGPRLKGRQSSGNRRNLANNALHAWACALGAMGTPMPPWRDRLSPPLSPLLKEYCHYRRASTMAYRREHWFAMLRLRVAFSRSWAAEGSLSRMQGRGIWTRLCRDWPPDCRLEPFRIVAVRCARFSDFCR